MTKQIEHQVKYYSVNNLYLLEDNPRTITRESMEKLKTSIQDNPDYFEARPLILSNRLGKNVVLAGNQRLRAAIALGLEEVPAVLLEGLDEDREKEIIIRDNVSNGDWDFDLLADNFDIEDLTKWGVMIDGLSDPEKEIVEHAGENYETELDDSTDYDFQAFYRRTIDSKYEEKIQELERKGEIHKEVAELLRHRIEQCRVFNFDMIARFYRSAEASEGEKELLRQLSMVIVRPKELIESEILKLDTRTKEIYHEISEGVEDDEE